MCSWSWHWNLGRERLLHLPRKILYAGAEKTSEIPNLEVFLELIDALRENPTQE